MKAWKKALLEEEASDLVDTAVAGTKRKAVSRHRTLQPCFLVWIYELGS